MKQDAKDNAPAFPAKSMDILSNALSRADNAAELAMYLTEEIRNITGAKCVLLIQCLSAVDGTTQRIIGVSPPQKREWAESPAANRLCRTVLGLAEARLLRKEEPSEVVGLLLQEGFGLSMFLPLNVGAFRAGGLLVLGLPDEDHIFAVLDLLKDLSIIIALALRNTVLYEKKEQLVRERAAELREEKPAMKITQRKRADEALSDVYEYIRQLISSANVMIIGLDAAGNVRLFNRAAEQITGYSIRELTGIDWFEKIVPKDRYAWVWQMFRSYQQKTGSMPAMLENPILTKSGEERFISWQNSTISAPGAKISLISFGIDITERKRSEEELRRLTLRNELILNSAGEGIYGTDINGNILFVNPAAADMMGFRVEELINKNSHNLFHHTKPDGKPYPLEECPLHKTLSEGEVRREQEEVFWTRDGKKIHIEHVNTPLVENGKTIGAVVVFRDITERRKVEETIRAAGAYHRSLIEASLDPLVTIGPDGTITDVNSSTERATGYSREKLIGTDFSEYFTEPDKARAGYQQVFREGMVQDYELEIRHRDGHATPVLYNASVYRSDKGDIIGVFAAARDITERKRMEIDLRRINEDLDLRVKERTAQLERKIAEIENLNRLFVGRELRMIELKDRIKELERELKKEQS